MQGSAVETGDGLLDVPSNQGLHLSANPSVHHRILKNDDVLGAHCGGSSLPQRRRGGAAQPRSREAEQHRRLSSSKIIARGLAGYRRISPHPEDLVTERKGRTCVIAVAAQGTMRSVGAAPCRRAQGQWACHGV